MCVVLWFVLRVWIMYGSVLLIYMILMVDCVVVNGKGVLVSPVWVDLTIAVTNWIAQPSLFNYDI